MKRREYPARVLEDVYRRHPVREQRILARLRATGKDLRRLTPRDLAEDPATCITDQNHVGGSRSVVALAEAVHVGRDDVVLDLGCGLGGSARLLAHQFGCRVDGIDISRQRVREGNRLNALVGMAHLVHLRRADMLRVAVPRARYDVLWGQSAWTHVADKPHLLNRWLVALRPSGRIALEDVYVKNVPHTAADRRLLSSLERDWHSTLVPLTDWKELLTTAGAVVTLVRDLTPALLKDLEQLERASSRDVADVPTVERRAWLNGLRAAACGLIGYFRMTAVVQPREDPIASRTSRARASRGDGSVHVRRSR